jgi:hypothetical protein
MPTSRTMLLVTLALAAASTPALAAPQSADASSPAADEHGPANGYFSVSGLLGAQRATHIGGAIDLGVRAHGDSPVFAHVMVAGGDSGFSADGGSFKQLRVGAEGRWCAGEGIACAFFGADVGYQNDHPVTREWILGGDIMETDADDLLLVPRIGTEFGRAVKLRTTLEMPLYTRIDGGAQESGYGIQATTGIGFAF